MLKYATAAAAALTLAASAAVAQDTAPKPAGQPAAKPATQPAGQPAAKTAPAPFKLLSVGDKAPLLTIEKWLKGDAITGFEKGKIYVLEFWSPTSVGSASNMPHLTELQKQYKEKGVTIIGVASKDPRTAADAVEKALKEKADVIGYTVAWDGERTSYAAYVEGAGAKYLPTTFIVDGTGTVAHIQSGDDKQLDKPLSEIVAGTYDLKKAADDYRTRSASAPRPGVGAVRAAAAKSDWAGMMTAYDALSERDKTTIAADVFETILLKQKDAAKASEFGAKAIDGPLAKDPRNLNQVAWAIVNPENKVEKKDLDLALKAANKADELLGSKNAAIIDTVARVQFCKGDLAKALELQKKAVAAITAQDPPEVRPELEKTLKEYEEAIKNKK